MLDFILLCISIHMFLIYYVFKYIKMEKKVFTPILVDQQDQFIKHQNGSNWIERDQAATIKKATLKAKGLHCCLLWQNHNPLNSSLL